MFTSPVHLVWDLPCILLVVEDLDVVHVVCVVDCGLDLEETFGVSDVFLKSVRHQVVGLEVPREYFCVCFDYRVGGVDDIVRHVPVVRIDHDLYGVSHVIDGAVSL